MRKKILDYAFTNEYMADQKFLAEEIYPHVKNDCLIHDEYYDLDDTPKRKIQREKLSTLSHIGCALDENDVYIYQTDRDMAIQETGHVTYIYDWGIDGRTNNR